MTPALLNRRLRQTGALVRLAGLRRDLAAGALASARRALAEAMAARDSAEQAARRLAADQAARRAVLRQPLLGTAQLRGALDSVLTTFAADREREAAALRALADAETMLEAARADVATAQAGLAAAERRLDRRRRLRAPLAEARLRLSDRQDDRAAEDHPAPSVRAPA